MEHRKRIDMTRSELGWTLIAVLLLGCLAGWALFGKHRLIDWVYDSGNAAEWAAAIGTWVIGLAAWKYARDSYTEVAKRAKQQEDGVINGVIWKAKQARKLQRTTKRLVDGRETLTNLKLKYALELSNQILSDVKWTDDQKRFLDRKALNMLGSLEYGIFGYIKMSEIVIEFLNDSKAKGSDIVVDHLHEDIEENHKLAIAVLERADLLLADLYRKYPSD